jgi:hypothetical protein
MAALEVSCKSVAGLERHRTPDQDLPAIAKTEGAIFVTYDLDFTTSVILAEMAKAGVCVVMIRRPKAADFAHTAEIILRNMRNWSKMCGSEPTIISCGLRGCRPRAVSSLPHLRGSPSNGAGATGGRSV